MSKDKIFKIAKYAAKLAVTSSVSKTVHDVIDANVNPETRLDKAMIWIGGIAISAVVTDRTWEHIEDTIKGDGNATEETETETEVVTETE